MIRAFIVACTLMGFMGPTQAQDLSDARVKELALEAILENPEIIMQAVEILREREQAAVAEGAQQIRLQLEADTTSPFVGNPDGDVTIIEFFDYNCGYCKRAMDAVRTTMAADPNVKVVMREWPILSEGSQEAARVALATKMQGKYEEFHWAMMSFRGQANMTTALKVARDLGLDMDQLAIDIDRPEIAKHLAESSTMARALGFTGTPAFMVGDELAPGFIPAEQLESLVEKARNG